MAWIIVATFVGVGVIWFLWPTLTSRNFWRAVYLTLRGGVW